MQLLATVYAVNLSEPLTGKVWGLDKFEPYPALLVRDVVETQSKRRRSAATFQPLEAKEFVHSLVAAINAQGASSTSASNEGTGTKVGMILQEMVSSYEIDNALFFKSSKFLGLKDSDSYRSMFLTLEANQRVAFLEAILS
ncbi:hypothetical protein GIB67_005391 [Kingdonia uniflora]|uniref:Uncharacterized protein n=1 Tax=Kingdonia uniflora TaxID=39325 RepID=A0A7J7NH13_9MAGN|nr:hypothetical protein GIB67_005391 [Kingdonia uniflora]